MIFAIHAVGLFVDSYSNVLNFVGVAAVAFLLMSEKKNENRF